MEKKTTSTQTHRSQEEPVKVCIVGTGAIGGYYGAQLAKAGTLVSTVHRSDFAVVREKGIYIDSIDGSYHFRPAQVLQHVADLKDYPDYILVALKVLGEISTAEVIRPIVGPSTTILLLQNGIEIEEAVAQAFPDNELLSGLAFICATRRIPGHIEHTCYGHLTVGRFPSGSSPAAQRLAQLFERAGTICGVSERIAWDRWKKLVWNAAFNPLSVLSQTTTREMLAHPASAQLVRHVMQEVCEIATAAGYPLGEEVIQKNLQATQRMKPYKTSMLQDYLAGRSMEVDAILGNPIRAAKRSHIDVPHMETLYAVLSLFVSNGHPPRL